MNDYINVNGDVDHNVDLGVNSNIDIGSVVIITIAIMSRGSITMANTRIIINKIITTVTVTIITIIVGIDGRCGWRMLEDGRCSLS